jgi:hypothetical protein
LGLVKKLFELTFVVGQNVRKPQRHWKSGGRRSISAPFSG